MKKNLLLSALLAASMFLSGCSLPAIFSPSDGEEQTEVLEVYRLSADSGENRFDLLRTENLTLTDTGEGELAAAIAAFASASRKNGLTCALPEGVTVESWSLENGVITLNLSAGYLSLSAMNRTATAFCAVLTLCQLENVEAVTITAGGSPVFTGLMPGDAVLADTDTDPYVRQLRLYFPDGDGRYLVSEYHSLTLDEETSPERYVIEELLRGPNNGELLRALPANTELISCATENGLCTVNLTGAFYENRPQTALGERLTIYSLVNSLTALSTVDSVRILVNGQPVDTYVYRSLTEPLSRYDGAVGPVSAPKGEFDGELYLPTPGLDGIAALPFRVSESGYSTRAEAVLAALLSTEEPGYPALFSGSGTVSDVSVSRAVCSIDLSESFFVSLPESGRHTAVQAIAATVCALPDISAVRFTIDGAAAVFDGEDFSGPWLEFDDMKVN